MLRRIGFVVLLSLALFLVLVAVNSNEPYLVKLRGGGHIALVLAAIGVRAAMICRGAWPGGIAKQVLLVTWCVPLVAFIAAQSVFAIRKYQALHTEAAVARLLGRHFVVGYDDPAEAATLAGKGLIAGVYVTRHNVAGRTAAELKAEIASLQAARTAAHLPPLIVAADQEGGIVAHLSPPLPEEPALSTLATVPPDQRQAQAKAYGRRQGAELAGIGVTLNLAPVLDLRPSWQRNRLDFNTLISQRDFRRSRCCQRHRRRLRARAGGDGRPCRGEALPGPRPRACRHPPFRRAARPAARDIGSQRSAAVPRRAGEFAGGADGRPCRAHCT